MREREIKVSNPLTGGGSNRGQSPPAPRPRKKGGNVWKNDREGLGWPPRELALLLALPRHQPTTIPPFLHKARDRKEEKGIKQSTSLPSPVPLGFPPGAQIWVFHATPKIWGFYAAPKI